MQRLAEKQKKKPTFLITLLLVAVCVVVGAVVLPTFITFPDLTPAKTEQKAGTGLWVTADDLFAGTDTEKIKDLHAEVDSLLTFAKDNGFAELYWDLSLGERYGDANTLGYLCRRASASGIKIYAVLPALSGDEITAETVNILTERLNGAAKAAKVDGFLLQWDATSSAKATDTEASSTDLREEQNAALAEVSREVAAAAGKPITLAYSGLSDEKGTETLAALISDSTVDRLLPVLSGTADDAYAKQVESWKNDFSGVSVRPLAAKDFTAREVGYQLYYNSLTDKDGFVLTGYERLSADSTLLQSLMSFAGAPAQTFVETVDLSCKQILQIGYPDNGLSTPYSTIYIMGISDPNEPLTLNGNEVERKGTLGCFGVQVSLAMGSNTFTFRQGDESATVTVKRYSTSIAGTISVVTAGSRFPVSNAAVLAGDTLEFRCVAPAGASVTATINGTAVPMQQKEKGVKKGIAAVYEGSFDVPASLDANSMNDLGQVTYTLTNDGKETSYRSEGHLYAAGSNIKPMVLATTENLSVITDYTDDSTITGTLHLGARIATTGCVQYNGVIYYKVQGGYVCAARCELMTDVQPSESNVTKITSGTEGRLTNITFSCGTYPSVTVERQEDKLLLHLLNTTLPEELSGISCPLISSAENTEEEGGRLLTLHIADPTRFWGYDTQYNERGDLVLTLVEAPTLSSTPGKPLEGVTVMVDPGHGNSDCGALGTPGATAGPTESELNLAVGLALQQRLEQLGATVQMVRTTDDPNTQKVVLDERVHMAVNGRPDIFLSIHHNSTALVKDVTADWMEAYYYDNISLPFAASLRENMMAATGRSCAEPEWGYYYVTRLSFCPAVLFEVGYLPNPTQYETCCDSLTVYRSACAMADAIVASIPEVTAETAATS